MTTTATNATSLADLTASELLLTYARGDASPVEVVESCLARIEALDSEYNAVRTLLAEPALESAAGSADRWARRQDRPLEGIPYGLKDIIATAGVATTGGSALYRSWVPDRSATLASRMDAAGGVLLAKLQTFEFACGGAANKTFGPVRNPWDSARTTGGSSSGSGAAVALGMVPVAIGTDTGGSIRIPAAYCGITGLKPTYGRVPRTGVMGLSWTMDHAGPMTTSCEDAALVLGVIAGHDDADAYSSARPVPDYRAELSTASLSGLRVGLPTGYLTERLHPEVAGCFEAAVSQLAALGATVVPVELPSIHLAEAAGWTIIYAEMLALHEGHLGGIDDRDEMGAGLLALGPFVSAGDYLRAQRTRTVVQREIESVFTGVDLLAMPGATTVAPRLADMLADTGDGLVDWLEVAPRTSLPFNLTGQPGLCLPAGLAGGMPASLELVGRPHDDATVLTAGAAYQRAVGPAPRPPCVAARAA